METDDIIVFEAANVKKVEGKMLVQHAVTANQMWFIHIKHIAILGQRQPRQRLPEGSILC